MTARIPMDEDVIPMVHAHIDARDAAGLDTYGKPLRTFDRRNTITDALEEALDTAVYLTKLRREWTVLADLLERAWPWLSGSRTAYEIAVELRETAARMRQDVARIEPKPVDVEQ